MTLSDTIPLLMMALLTVFGCTRGEEPVGSPTPETGRRLEEPALQPTVSETSASADNGRSALPTNPSQLRASATPKTLREAGSLSGHDKVQDLQIPSFNTAMRQKGQGLYQKTCARCHGLDGKPHDPDGTLARYNMANLANPLAFKYGADARGIYRSIAYGTAAPPHGIYKDVYSEQETWSLVAFVLTLDAR